MFQQAVIPQCIVKESHHHAYVREHYYRLLRVLGTKSQPFKLLSKISGLSTPFDVKVTTEVCDGDEHTVIRYGIVASRPVLLSKI